VRPPVPGGESLLVVVLRRGRVLPGAGLRPCRALVAERAGELAAQPGVFLRERAVAFQRGGQAGTQRRVAGALVGRDRRAGRGPGRLAQLLDLVADVSWVQSQDREMPTATATEANVTGVPTRSSSCSAWIARARVSSCRRPAATAGQAGGSGRTGGCLLPVAVCFEGGDDLVKVLGDLLVHLGDAGVPGGFGGGLAAAGR
jgi:hypothetical protein